MRSFGGCWRHSAPDRPVPDPSQRRRRAVRAAMPGEAGRDARLPRAAEAAVAPRVASRASMVGTWASPRAGPQAARCGRPPHHEGFAAGVQQADADLAPVAGIDEPGAFTMVIPCRNASPERGCTKPANPSGWPGRCRCPRRRRSPAERRQPRWRRGRPRVSRVCAQGYRARGWRSLTPCPSETPLPGRRDGPRSDLERSLDAGHRLGDAVVRCGERDTHETLSGGAVAVARRDYHRCLVEDMLGEGGRGVAGRDRYPQVDGGFGRGRIHADGAEGLH